jgi:hypothetical protein
MSGTRDQFEIVVGDHYGCYSRSALVWGINSSDYVVVLLAINLYDELGLCI